jgi:hypothetical protein
MLPVALNVKIRSADLPLSASIGPKFVAPNAWRRHPDLAGLRS